MTRILMVCLGNICRSPLAEGILKSKLPDHFIVDSTGTSNYHVGDQPDQRSIEVARTNGLDISNQRGRQFDISDFDTFDKIYVMDQSNFQNVVKLARNVEDIAKVKCILDEVEGHQNNNVPDPYYGGHDGFTSVYNLLDDACETIAKKLLS